MVRKKVTKIPKSKAKNAYDLLTEVRKLILEEPKRYNQEWWRQTGRPGERTYLAPEGLPACGTVACVAGWVTTLKPSEEEAWLGTEFVARRVLGLSEFRAMRLFAGDAIDRLSEGNPPEKQTLAYAKLGAKHIAAFQNKHKDQLKAKAV